MGFKSVFESMNNIDVQIAKSILDNEGIDSHIPTDKVSSVLPHLTLATGGVHLMVSEADYEDACKALTDFKEQLKNNTIEVVTEEEAGEEDSDDEAVLCPTCYSKNIEIVIESARGPILFLFSLFGIPVPVKKEMYHCKDCHRKWKK